MCQTENSLMKRRILIFLATFFLILITFECYVAFVCQMGTNYKAALIPQGIRETIHGWKRAARRKRRLGGFADDSTVHTDTSTVMSLEEYDHQLFDNPDIDNTSALVEIELQPPDGTNISPPSANETSSRVGTPLLRPSASISSPISLSSFQTDDLPRSVSMPITRG